MNKQRWRFVGLLAGCTLLGSGLCTPIQTNVADCSRPEFEGGRFIWDCNVNFDINDVLDDAIDRLTD